LELIEKPIKSFHIEIIMKKDEKPLIREANVVDIPAIQNLYCQGDTYHAELLPDIFESTDEGRDEDFIRSWIQNENCEMIVAEVGGRIRGFLNIKITSSPDLPIFKKKDYAQIEDCVVDKDYRNLGIGTELFIKAKQWAQKRGLINIQLIVWTKNEKARDFYLKRGFKDVIGKMEINFNSENDFSLVNKDPVI